MNKLVLCLIVVVWVLFPGRGFCSDTSDDGRLIYNQPFAPAEGLINKMEKGYRKEICLNGYWEFQPVALPSTYVQGNGVVPELPLPSEDAWSDVRIKIPSPWNVNAFANQNLAGPDHRNYPSYPKEWEQVKMAWMKKDVTIPIDWNGQQIKLYFEAVAGATVAYVNGEKVGENFDLFLPFSIDITNKVSAGETIEIWVGVRSQSLFEDNSTVGRRIVPAGSMWGSHIAGIWQDVYLFAVPRVHVKDVYVKPLVSKNMLELEVTLQNCTEKDADVQLLGDIKEWINCAGTDVNTAPVPAWELGQTVLAVDPMKISVPAGSLQKVTVQVPVADELKFWTPEHPNLYASLLFIKEKKQIVDVKYERFGWREWTLQGTMHCLNGKPYQLRGDSWHFMGVPQMTRRYAWAWFTAVKEMNGNAIRPHAQIYPRFYLDMADEMGICVLDETANWASDGGPKLDSKYFWEASKEHLKRFVLRDRNHASVFGWSISNENKPVILHVFNRPDLIEQQEEAWEEWRDIVHANDPTRPWISSDGEDDGNGILPVTIGHYGDMNSMKYWAEIGKPWGIGEHSMAYYGTPEQVSKYNGERAYESQLGRMEGLANECYNLLVSQRNMGASYSTVFNMVWYGLKPLPLGKKDLATLPNIEKDGVFFGEYKEGVPGMQPDRMGPYCTTLNPGYDPSLPLYDPWPMYDAMRAANAPNAPAWSPYAVIDKIKYEAPKAILPEKPYKEVVFVGKANGRLKEILDAQGVKWASKVTTPMEALYIVDGSYTLSVAEQKSIQSSVDKGADVWIWGLIPNTLENYNELLPLPVDLDNLKRSSFLPVQKSWMRGLNNSDFYFCELQRAYASEYSLKGLLVEEGEVLLNACKTDWRVWNKCPEELKTASIVRSENECIAALPVFVKYTSGSSSFYVSTLNEFTASEKGFNTLAAILKHAGVCCRDIQVKADEVFFLRDDQICFPIAAKNKLIKTAKGWALDIYVFSPRPLDDLLIEPNMPKLTLVVKSEDCQLFINNRLHKAASQNHYEAVYKELPLLQGWNKLSITIGERDKSNFDGYFQCDNQNEFLSLLKAGFENSK